MFAIVLFITAAVAAGTDPGKVEGKFVVDGVNAKLPYVHAIRDVLDEKGKPGYTVLVSERPAKGDIHDWKTGEPSEKGSFIYIQFEASGAIWVAEVGHTAAKSGRFGVVTEISTTSFKVDGGRLSAHIKTAGEQVFTEDRYLIDLTIDAPLEKK
jgi:hypothetical protein